jgi:hypothetical protein
MVGAMLELWGFAARNENAAMIFHALENTGNKASRAGVFRAAC